MLTIEKDTTRTERFSDAKYIIDGACNPVAICGTIHKHMLAMSRNGADHPTIKADPALRLMLHQLVYIMGMEDMVAVDEINEYADCMRQVNGDA